MADNRVVTELIIDARGAAAGSAEFQRRMEAAQRAVDRMIEREQKLNQSTQQVGQALEQGATSVAKRARQWDALAASLDPVIAAEQKAAKAIRDATQIADAGTRLLGRSQQEASAMVAEVTRREQAKVEAVKKGAQATDQLTKSSGLARHEMVNLSRQAQDVVVSLQGGQGLFTVLLQQGSQISDVFAASKTGTVGGFFKQAGEWASSIITPMRLAGGATVAAAGLAIFALNRWNDSQIALTRSLYGTGLSAGVTRQQLTDMAESAARSSKVAASAARETIAALASTGRIDPRLLTPVTAQAKGISATTGMDEVETNRLLAQSFAEPVAGYKRITDALGGYNIRVEDHIKSLVAQGKLYEAQQVLLQQIPGRLAPINEVTNQWARAWSAVSRGIKDVLDDVAKLTGGPLGRFMDTWSSMQRRVEEAGGGNIGMRRVLAQDRSQQAVTDIQVRIREAEQKLTLLQQEASNVTDAAGQANYRRRIASAQTNIADLRTMLTGAEQEAERVDRGMQQIRERTQQRNRQTQDQASAARGRETAASGIGRIDQVFTDATSRATTTTEAQARAEASLREELDRRTRSQNQATEAARQLSAVDAQGLRDLNSKINQYNQMTDAIRQMTQDRSKNPGLGENEQWRAQLEELLKTQGALRATIEGSLRNGGRGMFNTAEYFVGNPDQIAAQFRRQIDLTREQTAADIQQTQARTQNQRIAANQNAERISMNREGIAAGDEAARQARLQGVAQRVVAQDTQALTDAQRERRIATDATVRSIEAEAAALGGSAGAQEAARARVQMTNEARREYIRLFGINAQVPQAELDAIDEMAKRLGRARQSALELKAARDIMFERQLIGLPDGERAIARNLRGIYGDDSWRAQMNGALATQARFNDQLKLTGELMSGFGQSMIQDLRNGASLWDALGNAAAKMGDRLLSIAMDQAIKQLLGMFAGPLGGMFGGGSGYTAGAGGYMGAGPFMPNALGGVYTSPSLSAFSGGVYDTPRMFAFAKGAGIFGEAGPEAIMPLKRAGDGSLGVRAIMPRMQPPANDNRPVSVTVNNHSGAEVRESHDEQGNVRIDIVKAMEGALADRISRGRGDIGSAIGARFNIGQAGHRG